MENKPARWIQRYQSFEKALSQLSEAMEIMKTRELTRLEKQGLIQGFEYTHELAWKVMKDFLESRGISNLYGSRDATKESFRLGLIDNGEIWMQMIQSRNSSSHTYDESIANSIIDLIANQYYVEYLVFFQKMKIYLPETP